MANGTIVPSCNYPFLAELNYPSSGGDIAARFCTTINQGQQAVSCCLPCPTSYWIFDDSFQSRVDLASYISIISLVCNVFLLLTFLVLPQEKSHRHYLSVGLTSSFILVALSFVIPLGTQPELCYNDITPHNERTQASCAATGVFVELGALGVVVWVLLRSIWTALRITINIKHVNLFQNLSIALGIGLPILFMAISLPITSVSYSLGNVCVPSNPNAFQTWFVWILVFTGVSEVIQVATIGYCIWRFTSFSLTGRPDTSTGHSTSASVSDAEDATAGGTKQLTPRKQKHVAWKRARGILKLQWRSMVLAFIVVNLIVYFGMFFVQQSGTSRMQYLTGSPRLPMDSDDFRWMACLMANGGDKKKCLHGATGLGVKQQRVEATLILAPFIGIMVFFLMVRSSMFVGWWQMLRNPRAIFRRPSVDNEDMIPMGDVRPDTPPEQDEEKETHAEDEGQHEATVEEREREEEEIGHARHMSGNSTSFGRAL